MKIKYLMNKNYYGFKILSEDCSLDLNKLLMNGVTLFTDHDDFTNTWFKKLGLMVVEEVENLEYLIKTQDKNIVVFDDRGMLLDFEGDVEDLLINYVE